jgi:hypothetical protein
LLWPIIQSERRCLFTADKGFADVRLRQSGEHHGVVLFRLPYESRAGYMRLVEYCLAHSRQDDLSGALPWSHPMPSVFFEPTSERWESRMQGISSAKDIQNRDRQGAACGAADHRKIGE